MVPNEGLQVIGSTHDWMALKLHPGQIVIDSVHAHLLVTISKVVHVIVRVLTKRMSGMRGHAAHEVGIVSIGNMGRNCRGWA